MICQKCQSAEATIHTTAIVNGISTESHLCDKCSGDAGQGIPLDVQGLIQQMLGSGLSPLLNLPNFPNMPISMAQPTGETLSKACPHCGTTLADIQKTGKPGCPHDYQVFGEAMLQMVSMSQAGAQRHIGKVPSSASAETRQAIMRSRVNDLQRKLESAVFREDYELAAGYRDEIKATKAELDNNPCADKS